MAKIEDIERNIRTQRAKGNIIIMAQSNIKFLFKNCKTKTKKFKNKSARF